MSSEPTDGEESPVSASKVERGPDRLDMVDKVIPERDDWGAKTNLDEEDAWREAGLRNIGSLIPSVKHQQPTINNWLDDYEKAKTSEEGKSRQDIFSTVKSLFGGGGDDEGKAGVIVRGLGADED